MNANVTNMERQRLRDEQPRREMDEDETLARVRELMSQVPRYRYAMQDLVNDYMILKGEGIAINLGIEFDPEDES